MAGQLIASLDAEAFDPADFQDTYREKVLDLIEQKAAGHELVAAPEEPAAAKVVDLMAALEASVAAAKKSRQRHPARVQDDATSADTAGAKKTAARKPGAGKTAAGKTGARKTAARKSA